jgi:hypothetical protein
MRDLPRSLWLGLVVGFVLAGCSRNSSGTYSLPAGNPVVAGTTISSTTHNNTNSDLATELTDSLSRSGKGAMLAALQCYDGTVTAPGLTFATDPDSGLYRIGANNLGLALSGAKVVDYSTTGISVTGTTTSSGVLKGPNGAAGAPSFSFTSDTDTGVYRVGADDIALSAGSIKVLDCGVSCSIPVGLTVTQPSDNTPGITTTGTGTGAGIVTTGGDTGPGITATGGGTTGGGGVFVATGDGFGVDGTGSGTGYGVVGTGGADGVGGSFIGGSNGGVGVVGAGTGNSAGGSFSAGTNATGGTRQDAVTVTNGDIDLSGVADPSATTSVSDRLTPMNLPKMWARLTTSGASSVSITSGFNITSASIAGGGTDLSVVIGADMANANYVVVANGNGARMCGAVSTSTTGFVVDCYLHDGTAINFNTAAMDVSVLVFGAQ